MPEVLTLLAYLECCVIFVRRGRSDYLHLYLQIDPLMQAEICKAKV
jgi:hypothetical protein